MKTKPNDLIACAGENLGLTKREYFAAMALQGLASKDYAHLIVDDLDELQRAISSTAVEMADALIHQLNLEP